MYICNLDYLGKNIELNMKGEFNYLELSIEDEGNEVNLELDYEEVIELQIALGKYLKYYIRRSNR